jgi:hypothetical protein
LRKTTEPLLETNRNARASNPIGEALQRTLERAVALYAAAASTLQTLA